MKSPHQQRVEQFMRKAGQDLPEKPVMPPANVRIARARLIMEEALETIEALGFVPAVSGVAISNKLINFTEVFVRDPNLAKAIDGCCDLIVVATGTLSAMGCPDTPFQEEVDAANLRKFSGDAHLDENGKWVKPTGFKGPDIEGVLARIQGDQP